MQAKDVLIDAFGRLPELVEAAVDGLSPDQLRQVPNASASPVAWLVWHLTRVQDSHVAELLDGKQVYTTGGWAARFGLADDPSDTGYGHTPAQVRAVTPESADVLVGYYTAVHDRTVEFLRGLSDADLDRVVDEAWDPPVTLGVRLVSVYDDDTQHVGQAAYVRGVLLGG